MENKDNEEKPFSTDALDGYPTVKSWEENSGRGFWGNETTGYHYDNDDEDMSTWRSFNE